MNIGQCMKRQVISVPETSTVREVAAIFVEKHVGLLPVVTEDHSLVGVVGLRDLLALGLPDFMRLVKDVDFVHDFGAVETTHLAPSVLDRSIRTLLKPAITVQEDSGLLRAYALMLQQDLHDMPVVSADGRLVGIASRVDIGAQILLGWTQAV
jgi:CBS domain-containing protein